MSDLTAADLARLDALAEAVTSPARRTEYGELWVRASPRPRCDDDAVVIARQDIAALVVTVREQARAIVGAEWNGNLYEDDDEICPFCEEHWKNTPAKHAPDCIVHRARALLGA